MAGKRGNNEGSIFKRNDGTWCAMVTEGRDPKTGKLIRRSFYGKTRQEVSEKLSKAQEDLRKGTLVENTRIKVGQWLDDWLTKYKKGRIRPTTYDSYEMVVRVHIKPYIGNVFLKDLKPENLQAMYNDKLSHGRTDDKGGLSTRTVRYMHMIMHEALKQALKNNLVSRNIAEATTPPKLVKREMRVLSKEEQNKFLDVLEGERLGPAFLIDIGTGLRRGELLTLRWSDIDFGERVIRVSHSLSRVRTFEEDSNTKSQLVFQQPKTKSGRRSIPMLDNVYEALKEHKVAQEEEKKFLGSAYQDNGLVFCTELGKPIEPRNFNRKFYELLDKAGIEDANLHCLRHTFATRGLELGMNPKVMQELMGHSSIMLFMDTYAHVLPDLKKRDTSRMNLMFERRKPEKDKGPELEM